MSWKVKFTRGCILPFVFVLGDYEYIQTANCHKKFNTASDLSVSIQDEKATLLQDQPFLLLCWSMLKNEFALLWNHTQVWGTLVGHLPPERKRCDCCHSKNSPIQTCVKDTAAANECPWIKFQSYLQPSLGSLSSLNETKLICYLEKIFCFACPDILLVGRSSSSALEQRQTSSPYICRPPKQFLLKLYKKNVHPGLVK